VVEDTIEKAKAFLERKEAFLFPPAKIDRVLPNLSRIELLAALNRPHNLDILYLARIYLQWIAIKLY
jgi:hypothetical protein